MSIYKNTELDNPSGYVLESRKSNDKMARSSLAPKIRVNSIILGGVEEINQICLRRIIRKCYSSRMASNEDIKGAIVFLGTDLSSYTTGSFIFVDGGWCN